MKDFYRQPLVVRARQRKPLNPRKFINLLIFFGIIGGAFIPLSRFISAHIQSSQTYEFHGTSLTPSPTPKPLVEYLRQRQQQPTRRFGSNEEVIIAVSQLTQDKHGQYGWFVQSLTTGETYGTNTDKPYTAASVNKVPIMVRFLLDVEAGSKSLADSYTLSAVDLEGGAGSMQYQPLGTVYTLGEILELMGKLSDNTAANAMLRTIGEDRTQAFIDEQGMTQTRIPENTTSPKDMGELFSSIYLNRIFKKEATKKLLFDVLTDTEYEDRIPVGVPEGVKVVHKIGNQIQVWNDCGLVLGPNPYSLCILTDQTWENEAQEVLPEISRIVWDYESKRK